MILFAATLTIASPDGQGVTLTPMAIEELSKQADLIVHGTVLSKSCQRDDRGQIYTRVEIRIAEIWKGATSGAVITVVHGGGTLGEERAFVSGQVEYAIGEEVAGFFIRNKRGEAVTLALCQGKFRVWTDPRTGEKLATNPFHGTRDSVTGPQKTSSAQKQPALSLDRLRQQVEGGAK